MKLHSRVGAVMCVVLSGCASTTMYTADGFLTDYGQQQTQAEMDEVGAGCTAKFAETDSRRYECFRQAIPLEMRMGQEFAAIYAAYLSVAKAVMDGLAAGSVSEAAAKSYLADLQREYRLDRQILVEQYNRVVLASNARAREIARRNLSNALSQVGSTLLEQSSPSSSRDITCTETVPGVVSCSEW